VQLKCDFRFESPIPRVVPFVFDFCPSGCRCTASSPHPATCLVVHVNEFFVSSRCRKPIRNQNNAVTGCSWCQEVSSFTHVLRAPALFIQRCLLTHTWRAFASHSLFTETESTRFFRVETVLDLEQQWKQEPNQTNISGLHQFHICADDVLIPS
jgi:hypothetical protein